MTKTEPDYDTLAPWAWMDGKIIPSEQAQISIATHSLHHAGAAFEGERQEEGQKETFRSRDHTRRLFNSMALIEMELPQYGLSQPQFDPAALEKAIDSLEEAKNALLEKNGLSACYMRVIAFRGAEKLGVSIEGPAVHIAIIIPRGKIWDQSYFSAENKGADSGISLKTLGVRDYDDLGLYNAKTSANYFRPAIYKKRAGRMGFKDILMLDYEGNIAECSAANIFFIDRDGVLHTPTPDRFLNGITRQSVVQMARNMGMKVQERRIKPGDIANMAEVFITGSAAKIVSVTRIDDKNFEPGATTRKLQSAYQDLVRSDPVTIRKTLKLEPQMA